MIRPVDWIKQPSEDLARLLGKAFFYLLKRTTQQQPVNPESIKSILFVRRNKLGDAISVLPTIQAIKQHNPDVMIDVIANPYNKIIFELSDFVDNVYSIPERYLKNRYLLYFHPEIKSIRKTNKYDIAIGAAGSYSSATAWLVFCISSIHRAGVVSDSGHLMDLIYTVKINQAQTTQEKHQVKKIALLAKSCNLIDNNDKLPSAQLAPGGALGHNNTIALCPITYRENSRWSDNNWLKLAELLENLNIRYAWFGYKPDGALEGNGIIYSNDTADFIKSLSRYRLIVCSEGGTSHIAPALNRHTIILSGVNISQSWIPWSNDIILFEKEGLVNNIKPNCIIKQITHQLDNGAFIHSDGGIFNENFNS